MAISLEKGSVLSLKKSDGGQLTKVLMGLGWDEVMHKRGLFGGLMPSKDIDLDASVIMLDGSKRVVDIVYYGSPNLRSKDGSIRHTGDNLTGDGDGDDEQIIVDLSAVPASVESLVFVITSYSGQTFDQIENVFCRLADVSTGRENEVVRFDLKERANQTGMVMAKVYRSGSEWVFAAVGAAGRGKTAHDLKSLAVTV
jgi:tellurium resistance protein TerZ